MHTLHIVGTEGRIEWGALLRQRKNLLQGGRAFETLMPGRHFERNEMFLDQTADFMDCILQDKDAHLHTARRHPGIGALPCGKITY